MTAALTPAPAGTDPRRWWTLAALVLAVLAVGLDGTVLNVALPTLADSLHASTSQLQWFVAGYTLVLAAALLPAGLLGDRYGRRLMLLVALGVFGAGSVACAYATSPGWFIAARVVAGLGAALLVPVTMSIITVAFDEESRPKAVGAWAAANFLALPVGPILGGWLLSHFWWGWVFLVNVPVVLIGAVVAGLLIPESRGARRSGIDALGITLSSAGLAILTYGFIEAGQHGWGAGSAVSAILGGLALLAAFVGWERHVASRPDGEPLVDLGLFRSPSFSWGTVLAALGIFTMFGVLFTAPQYFQAVLGADAMGSGVRLLPVIAGVAIGAATADRVAKLAGRKITVTLGFMIIAAGMFLGARTGLSSGDGFIATWTAVCGLGMGMALTTAASAALDQLRADRAGVGSALMQTVQKAGAPMAVALLGSILNAGYRDRLPAGLPSGTAQVVRDSVFGGLALAQRSGSAGLAEAIRLAFVHGMDLMLIICGVLGVVCAVLAVAFMPGRRRVPVRQQQGDQAESTYGAHV